MRAICAGLAILIAGITPSAAAGQTEIRPGDPALDPGRLKIGTDTVHLIWEADGQERPGPNQIEELAVEWSGGDKLLRQVMSIENTSGRVLSDTTWYRFDTLAPLAHRSHAAQRMFALEYRSDSVSGSTRTGEEYAPVAVELASPVFDPSSSILVLQSLPLRSGSDFKIPLFDHAELAVIWNVVEVVGLKAINVGGASVSAWELTVHISEERPNVTYWIAEDDHRLLQVEAPLGDGRTLRGSVSSISPRGDLD